MKTIFIIENVKCLGCKNTIIKEAKKQIGVSWADVNIDSGEFSMEYNGSEETLARVRSRLRRRGYPQKGNNNTLSTAKSYVSCMIGRLDAKPKIETDQLK